MSEAELNDVPEEIERLCERCIAHVKNRFDLELDFTIDTLSVLDHFIEQIIVEEADGKSVPPKDSRRSHVIHLLAPSLGAYYGEVIRKAFLCRWRNTDDKPQKWLLEFEGIILRFNPAGVVADVVFGDHIESWRGSLSTTVSETGPLKERLDAAPPIPEEEFFSLVTSLEVLQIANEYLRERAKKNGGVSSTRSDYDTEFTVS